MIVHKAFRGFILGDAQCIISVCGFFIQTWVIGALLFIPIQIWLVPSLG